MTDEKPIILHVELSDLLRQDVNKRLRADMPGFTVSSVGNYREASDLLNRCLGQGIVPLIVTEARPVEAGEPSTPAYNKYGSALAFIERALTAGATVIVFTDTATNVGKTVPGKLVTVEKPDYSKLLTEIRSQTSLTGRTPTPEVVAKPPAPRQSSEDPALDL